MIHLALAGAGFVATRCARPSPQLPGQSHLATGNSIIWPASTTFSPAFTPRSTHDIIALSLPQRDRPQVRRLVRFYDEHIRALFG